MTCRLICSLVILYFFYWKMWPTIVIISHLSSKFTARATRVMHTALCRSFIRCDYYQTSTYAICTHGEIVETLRESILIFQCYFFLFRYALTLIFRISRSEEEKMYRISNSLETESVPTTTPICRLSFFSKVFVAITCRRSSVV